MKNGKIKLAYIMFIISSIVFMLALTALIFGSAFDEQFNIIGIRIATLLIAFASFISSTSFSFLVYLHNRTVGRINDDTNKRAELFRELQFASSNYSIVEFMDSMLIYNESERYIQKVIKKKNMIFHMIEQGVSENDVMTQPELFHFISVKIPFKVVEGKMASHISFDKLTFEREDKKFYFITPPSQKNSQAFILYNDNSKRNNAIINLILPIESNFLLKEEVSSFSKIKIRINITSLLGVRVKGISELYFTNPEEMEGNGSNTYRINSSNFTLTEMPKVVPFTYDES